MIAQPIAHKNIVNQFTRAVKKKIQEFYRFFQTATLAGKVISPTMLPPTSLQAQLVPHFVRQYWLVGDLVGYALL